MKSTKSVSVKHIRTIALMVLVAVLFTVSFLLFKQWEDKQGTFPKRDDVAEDRITYNGAEYKLKDNVETVLVIGLDTFGDSGDDSAYNNDKLADFLMLLVLDNQSSTVNAIQINRDTMADINVLGVAGEKVGTVNRQIALSHTYGNGKEVSCRNTADAVSGLFMNVKIDHYFSLTMDAVQEYNDLLGGVSVEVLDDFSGIDDTLKQGETVTLTGAQALTYVRTRYGLDDSSNVRRMERQRQYLQSLYNATKTKTSAEQGFAATASSALSKYMVSNCTVNQMQNIISKVTSYATADIRKVEGESVKGEQYMEFYPNEDAVKSLVIDLFYTKLDT